MVAELTIVRKYIDSVNRSVQRSKMKAHLEARVVSALGKESEQL